MKYLLLALLVLPTLVFAKTEAEYVAAGCVGEIEHRFEDGTRADCLTDTYAFEYDFCPKWAQAIGQSLHYARLSCKHPAIVLICAPDEKRFIDRIKPLADELGIALFIEER